jgi:hypothetical protein
MFDPTLLAAIGVNPNIEGPWASLAAWLRDNGRDDEADAVRVFWPRLSACVRAGWSVHTALRDVARHAAWWGRQARQVDYEARHAGSPRVRPTDPAATPPTVRRPGEPCDRTPA